MSRRPSSIDSGIDRLPMSLKQQGGGVLIESLIGLLILGLIGGGIMHSTARMTVAQHDMTVHNIAVSQMRSILMTGTTATGGDVCVTSPSIQLPGSESATNVVVKGCGLTAMTISGIKIDGASLAGQTINAARPRIFEIGSGNSLVRIGGKIDEDI